MLFRSITVLKVTEEMEEEGKDYNEDDDETTIHARELLDRWTSNFDSNYFYRKLSGRIIFNNMGRQLSIRLEMNNAHDEFLVGSLIYGRRDLFRYGKNKIFKGFAPLIDMINVEPLIPVIRKLFYQHIQFLNNRGREVLRIGGNNQIKEVESPFTGRYLKPDTAKYRQLYGRMILRNIVYKDISKYIIKKYDIETNCVIDYLKQKKGMKKIAESITGEINTYKLIDVGKEYGFSVIQRDLDYEIVNEYKCKDSKFVLDYIAFNKIGRAHV